MCNSIHLDGRVPKRGKGKGWKLFEVDSAGEVHPLMDSYYTYRKLGVWIVWAEQGIGDGFCFLFRRREAEKALRLWKKRAKLAINPEIRRIEYKGVVARQVEEHFIQGNKFNVGLCLEFRVLP